MAAQVSLTLHFVQFLVGRGGQSSQSVTENGKRGPSWTLSSSYLVQVSCGVGGGGGGWRRKEK